MSFNYSDVVGLVPKFFFGINTQIRGNVHYITEEDVVYPNGGVLIVHNFPGKRQKYIKLPEKGYNVNLIVLSPNRKIIAVAEIGDPANIILYDTASLKRKRTLTVSSDRQITARTIECMSFTSDAKNLIVIYGEPDWMMVSFKADRGKIESMTRANNIANNGTVRQIACNPTDTSVVALVGDLLFRMLAITENVWRQYGYSKAENLYLRCAAWLSQERLVAGTKDGNFMVVENGELKIALKIADALTINFQLKDEMQQASATQLVSSSVSEQFEENELKNILVFAKGFLISYGIGKVILFEKETAHKFKKRNLFKLDDIETKKDNSNLSNSDIEPKNNIQGMSLSPTQDYLVVSCGIKQLYFVYLWGPDITRAPEIKFNELGPSLHRGGIFNIAVCLWKPILVTVSREDRSIRIWNYESSDLIVNRVYQEDIYGVSLHPTGLYVLVGFSGKLRFLTVLIDDFAVTREFAIRYCSVIRFSTQGHLFAAVNGNVIQIYSSISFENVINLKGHNGKVSDVSWSANDHKLVSCGTEGALYEWEMETGRRTLETIIKTCSFTGNKIVTDGKNCYTVGSDGEVKEIINGVVRTNHPTDQNGLDCLDLSKSDQILFVSGKQGTIFSVKLPLSDKPEHLEYNMHNKSVCELRISYDDKYLISCSVDGSFCIWKLVNVMGRGIKLDKDFKPSADILIPYKDLEEKIDLIRNLNTRLTELDREHAYQIRQIVQGHADKLSEVHDAYKEAIDNLKDKNHVLETEHVQEIHAINVEIAKTKRTHEQAVENLEATYNEKLIHEYNKYTELEAKVVKIRQAYDIQIEDMVDDRKEAEEKICEGFEEKLKEKDVVIEELKEEMQQQQRDHEVIKQQIEDDADREIYELKSSHEVQATELQAVNIKLGAENGIFRKKYATSLKEVDELKQVIFQLENDHAKFKNAIQGLEKDILELRKEIVDRDETIQEKEKRIYELKKKAQELEKYKFVLDFKITELKAEIEPRERKIHDQQEQINEMITELENLQKQIIQLDLLITELKERLMASHTEVRREQAKFRQACDVIKSMRTDLHNTSGFIQDVNRLKIAVRDMFHKYNADKEFVITRQEDCEAKNEFIKQRRYLESNIGRLKKTVLKGQEKHNDKIIMMEESNKLITEVNTLRNQLKLEQHRNRQMESILGLTKKIMQPREAQRKLNEAVKTREDIHKEYEAELATNADQIVNLKDENIRLTNQLCEEVQKTKEATQKANKPSHVKVQDL